MHACLLHCNLEGRQVFLLATAQIKVCCTSCKQSLILGLVIYDTLSTSLTKIDFSKSAKLRVIEYNWKLKNRVGLNVSLISLDA